MEIKIEIKPAEGIDADWRLKVLEALNGHLKDSDLVSDFKISINGVSPILVNWDELGG